METVIRPRSEMKYSGIDLIGDMPQDWCICRLKNICRSFNSNITTNAVDKEIGKYKIFGASGLNGYIEFETMENEYLGIVKDGAGVGRIDVYPPHSSLLGTLAYIIPNNRVNMKWLKYIIQNMNLGESVDKTTIPHIYFSAYGNNEIPFPSAKEQQDIADYLDEKCMKIDEIIDEEKASIVDYKALKQSIIFETITKGLDQNVEMKDSGSYWIGEIPQTWQIMRTKYVVKIENGSDPSTEGTIPVYGSGTNSFKTCGEYKEGPTVLLGRKGATLHIPHYIEGRYWNVDTAFNTVPIEGKINLKYFYYVAGCFDYNRYISQTTLPSMTQTSYKDIYIPYPPIDVQSSIALWLDDKMNELDSLITEKEALINDLESYKKSLIYEVVTGKRRVV